MNATSLIGRRSLLVAAVAWGTGTNARPLAFRAKIFTDNSAAWIDERLTKALAILAEGDPVGAYLVMNELGAGVKHLGPAFFTKVLYFAGGTEPSGQLRPLILDQNVVKALNALVPDLAWDPAGRWTSSQYAVYLEHAHSWAERWHAAPDVVERTLFEFGRAEPVRIDVSGTLRPWWIARPAALPTPNPGQAERSASSGPFLNPHSTAYADHQRRGHPEL